MTDEREITSPASRATETTTTASSTPSAPAASAMSQAAVTFEMTTKEAQKLERDMQMLPADQVKLPDGRTLKDVIAQREAAQKIEGEKASDAAVEAMQAETSSVLPEKHSVTITAAGDLIVAPISDVPAKAEPKK